MRSLMSQNPICNSGANVHQFSETTSAVSHLLQAQANTWGHILITHSACVYAGAPAWD